MQPCEKPIPDAVFAVPVGKDVLDGGGCGPKGTPSL
jgi:hypothetical protein